MADEINIATLKPNENLTKLRAELKTQAALRKEFTENPSAVLSRFGLSVALPTGTISRLSAGGGFTFPRGGALHGDVHADAHLDINPHIDQNPHIDLG